MSTTSTPARLTHAIMFCIDDELPVTTWTFTSRRLPVMPTGTRDAVLVVDDEVLRQHVQDLAAARQRHRPRGVDRALHVLARDLAVAPGDGDHAAAVERLDVRARQRQVHAVDLDAGRQLGLVDAPS